MIVIFPMNGTGERFKAEGYQGPKYFLPVSGSTMIETVVARYPDYWQRVFAVWHEDAEHLARLFPTDLIIKIYQRTAGPVHTLLQPGIKEFIESCDDIVVADCDSLIGDIEAISVEFFDLDADACSPVRKTTDQWASYCKIYEDKIIETREKEVFSTISTTGPYFWKSGKQYIDCAIGSKLANNSPLFNELIARNGVVVPIYTDSFYHIGTPELYQRYLESKGCDAHS
jgi:molybdopterin-guanine dinucleotide biosynthesis protein A